MNYPDIRWARAFPILVGLIAGMATLGLWQAVAESEGRARAEVLEARAFAAQAGIEAQIRVSAQALQRMANRWRLRRELVSAQWFPDAELYVQHEPAYRALLWLDRQWSPRLWVDRSPARETVRGTGPGVSARLRSALKSCTHMPAAQIFCRPAPGDPGGLLLVITPIGTKGQAAGFIIGAFDLPSLLGASLQRNSLPGYGIAVTESDRVIFQSSRGDPRDGHLTTSWNSTGVALDLPGVTWRVQVGYVPAALSPAVSPLPRTVLSGGLVVTALLVALAYVAQTSRRQATDLSRLNRELGKQMQVCSVAQTGLQQRERILSAVSSAAEGVLRGGPMDNAITRMLHQLGESVGVSRVHVSENQAGADGEAFVFRRFEWCAPGVEPLLGKGTVDCLCWHGPGRGQWQARLGGGEPVIVHATEAAPREKAALAAQGAVSALVIPIFADKRWWGCIGFDECAARREWADAEINALRMAASVVGAAIAHVRAEMELRESETRFRQLADNVREIFWIVDPRARRLLYVSPAYEEIWGMPCAALYEDMMSFLQAVYLQDRGRVRDVVEEVIRDPRPIEIEFRINRTDGETRWIRSRGFPVRGEKGPVLRIVGITEDVTERRHAEEARVAHAERQRDTLVREVHHRINNNLQGVMSLLRQHIRLYPEVRGILEDTIAQINAVAAIHGLKGRGRGRQVRVAELVSGIVAGAHATRVSLPIAARLGGAEGIVVAEAEAVPVALIVNELLLNAMKHADDRMPGGRIEIFFERRAGGLDVRVINPAKGLPAGFDFDAGRGIGTGLGLIKSLLPPKGVSLGIRFTAGKVEANLALRAPVVGGAEGNEDARTGT